MLQKTRKPLLAHSNGSTRHLGLPTQLKSKLTGLGKAGKLNKSLGVIWELQQGSPRWYHGQIALFGVGFRIDLWLTLNEAHQPVGRLKVSALFPKARLPYQELAISHNGSGPAALGTNGNSNGTPL